MADRVYLYWVEKQLVENIECESTLEKERAGRSIFLS
jgi:hypothetical protein